MAFWTYEGNSTPERRQRLEAPKPYSELLAAVKASPLACFHNEPRQRDDSYTRADFCLDVGTEVFDAFFNASTGYRGAFFAGPDNGVLANQMLLTELCPVLVEKAIAYDPRLDIAWLIESLSLPTAKAWLAEDLVARCSSCVGGWSASHASALRIRNDRWEHSVHTHATWGRQAPELSKLRIFGGFVNRQHGEWVANHKFERAQNIWEYGWT